MKARVYDNNSVWRDFLGSRIVELYWDDGCSVQLAGWEVDEANTTRLLIRVWPKNGADKDDGDKPTFLSLRLHKGEEGWEYEDTETDLMLLTSYEEALTRAEDAEATVAKLKSLGQTLMREYRHRMGGDTPEIVDFEDALAVPKKASGGLCQVCNLAMLYHLCICSENDVISETPRNICPGCEHSVHPGTKCPVDMSDHTYEPPNPSLECLGRACGNGPDCDLLQGHLPGA